jgi:hypothetical protein
VYQYQTFAAVHHGHGMSTAQQFSKVTASAWIFCTNRLPRQLHAGRTVLGSTAGTVAQLGVRQCLAEASLAGSTTGVVVWRVSINCR